MITEIGHNNKITLTVVKNRQVNIFKFDTITEAYNYYVKHYATVDEWLYYLRVAHKLLHKVKNEHIMECIFYSVFTNGCIAENRS